jgi:hypothetical protein
MAHNGPKAPMEIDMVIPLLPTLRILTSDLPASLVLSDGRGKEKNGGEKREGENSCSLDFKHGSLTFSFFISALLWILIERSPVPKTDRGEAIAQPPQIDWLV